MNKFFRVLMICFILLASVGIMPGLADPDAPHPVYIPLMSRFGFTQLATHTVTGMVRDSDNYPVAGVLIEDVNGASAMTGPYGTYSIEVEAGPNTLTATRSGYDIAPLSINVTTDLSQVNFEAQVGCGSIVVNEGVTTGQGGWDFFTSRPDDVDPGTDPLVFRSAPSSGRVGINPGVDVDTADGSITRARSQPYHIPSDADAVFLGLWVNHIVTGAGEFDRLYVDIVDADNEVGEADDIISSLYISGVSTAGFIYLEFPLDTLIGETIRIQIRDINFGQAFTSTAYFDDVQLIICNLHCDNQITNGGFESQSLDPAVSGWLYIGPQLVPPAYSGTFFHTGLWSMRTGIPLGMADMVAFTEVFQEDIKLPSDQSGAMLTFWLYTTRQNGVVPPVGPAPPADLAPTQEVPSVTESSFRPPFATTDSPEQDWLYVYVYDDDGNFLDKLIWEEATNTNTWTRYRFDLSEYMGTDLTLIFGTYNDGRGGPSAMYIDDVILGTCD